MKKKIGLAWIVGGIEESNSWSRSRSLWDATDTFQWECGSSGCMPPPILGTICPLISFSLLS